MFTFLSPSLRLSQYQGTGSTSSAAHLELELNASGSAPDFKSSRTKSTRPIRAWPHNHIHRFVQDAAM